MVEFKEQKCHTFEISYIKILFTPISCPINEFCLLWLMPKPKHNSQCRTIPNHPFLIASNLRLLTGILAAWVSALVKKLSLLEIFNITYVKII